METKVEKSKLYKYPFFVIKTGDNEYVGNHLTSAVPGLLRAKVFSSEAQAKLRLPVLKFRPTDPCIVNVVPA